MIRAFDGGSAALMELGSARTLGLIRNTALLTIATTVSCAAIGMPLGWYLSRSDLPARRLLTVLASLPLVVPSYVAAYAWVAALGPRGTLAGWLAPLGVERLPEIYGFWGAWLVLTLVSYPYVMLPVRAAASRLDPATAEVARSLGMTGRRAFFRVTAPTLRNSVAAGSLLVALYTLHDFGAVSLLRYDAFTRAIHTSYTASFNRTSAAVQALCLVALSAVVVAAESRTRRAATPSHRVFPTRLEGRRWVPAALVGTVSFMGVGVPVAVILTWLYRGLVAGSKLTLSASAVWGSVSASALGAAAAVLCAGPVSWLSAKHPSRTSTWIERLTYTGHALPGIVIALSLVFFGARVVPAIYQTRALLTFGYTVLFLPLAISVIRPTMEQIPASVPEVARSLGAGGWSTTRRVVLPLLRPGILTAAALVFLTAMKELPATLLLSPIGYKTLAVGVWGASTEALFSQAAVSAVAIIICSSIPLAWLVLGEIRGNKTPPGGVSTP